MAIITEELTWEAFKEADWFTRAAHLGAVGLAIAVVTAFPLFLLFGEGSWMGVWGIVVVAMYSVIFGSALLRIVYYRYQGVPILEQLGAKTDHRGETDL